MVSDFWVPLDGDRHGRTLASTSTRCGQAADLRAQKTRGQHPPPGCPREPQDALRRRRGRLRGRAAAQVCGHAIVPGVHRRRAIQNEHDLGWHALELELLDRAPVATTDVEQIGRTSVGVIGTERGVGRCGGRRVPTARKGGQIRWHQGPSGHPAHAVQLGTHLRNLQRETNPRLTPGKTPPSTAPIAERFWVCKAAQGQLVEENGLSLAPPPWRGGPTCLGRSLNGSRSFRIPDPHDLPRRVRNAALDNPSGALGEEIPGATDHGGKDAA